jgi:histidine triad (HIT) family protein
MYNHAPKGYRCPFCQLASGVDLDQDHSLQSDIIYKNKSVMAFIARDQWSNNLGHVLIAPIKHYENIYDLPDDLIAKIHKLEKRVALAIKKAYKAGGVSSRQHNEVDGGQDVWHYHLAIFPRYKNDELYLNIYKRSWVSPKDRKRYALKLKKVLG